MAPGATVKLTVLRKGEEKTVTLTLGDLPDQREARAEPNTRDQSGTAVPRLGLTLAPAGEVAGSGNEGVVVTNVDPDGLAAEHGLKTGDVILEVAGKKVGQPGRRARCGRGRPEGRQAHRADAREVGRRHQVRRPSARHRLNRMGRSAGIRRPRRWCEPGDGQRKSPVPTS